MLKRRGSKAIEKERIAIERLSPRHRARLCSGGSRDPLTAHDTAKPGLLLKAYRALTRLATPFAPLILAWRTRRGKEERDRRPERYGLASAAAARVPCLVPCRERRRGQCRAAGDRGHRRRAAGNPRPAHDRHRDLGAARARRGCRRARCINMCRSTIRPSCSVSCAIGVPISPCWSNWKFGRTSCWRPRRVGIPLLLINGRMSASSFKRWRQRPGMSRPLFSAFDLVLAQNDSLAERFARARRGPRARRRQSQGRCAAASGRSSGAAQARTPRLPGAPFGSPPARIRARTRSSMAAHLKMKPARPDLLTIIVPRHPERGPLIAEQLRAEGLKCRAALRRKAAGRRYGHLRCRHDRRARPVLCARRRSPSSAARSSIAADRTRSSRSSSAPR